MNNDRDRFISAASELEQMIARAIDNYASDSKKISVSITRVLEELIADERLLIDRDESTAQTIADLERHNLLLVEILSKMEERKTAFQIRFDEGLIQCAELKVRAFTHISSYLEKLTITGIGSLGLSVTVLGFLYARATPQHMVSHIVFAFISWLLLFSSILIAAIGQLQFTKMSHGLLHRISDMASASLIKESARIYMQTEVNEAEAKDNIETITQDQIRAGQASPVSKQSAINSQTAFYAVGLISGGFIFLLLFVISNRDLFVAAK